MDESYSPNSKSLGISGGYSYNYDPKLETAIGDYFRVQFPDNWEDIEKYGFNWQDLSMQEEPIERIDFDNIKQNNYLK